MSVKEVAERLQVEPMALEQESLRVYLEQRLKLVESELFELTFKYGVKDVDGFDEKIKEGKFREEDSFEDFFKFDNLEAERDRILETMERL
ncbi:MAG: hypothetical protein QME07_01185 [bacterium]|nr:hypothetical protein [bacterium]